MSILFSKTQYIFSKETAPYILWKHTYFNMRIYKQSIHMCLFIFSCRFTIRAPAFSNVKIANDEWHWCKRKNARKLTKYPCFDIQWCIAAAGDRGFGRQNLNFKFACMWHARDTLSLTCRPHVRLPLYLTASCRAWQACHAVFDNFLHAFGRTRSSLNNARRATRSAS